VSSDDLSGSAPAECGERPVLFRPGGVTDAPDRAGLTEILAQALEEAIRCRTSCAFLVVAVDELPDLNDAYGFAAADEIIGAVGNRLRATMRGGDALGRFSTSKFGIVLKSCSPDDMAAAAERMQAAVRSTVLTTAAGPLVATVTVGGVVAPRHARRLGDVIARAQEALDVARSRGQGSFAAYRPNVGRDTRRRENARAADEIVAALNDRRIVLACEPVVAIASRRVVFKEALMRLRRHDGSLAAASEVIPVAERLGLTRLIDRRMLELATAALAADPELRLSLNVSRASVADADWRACLAGHLRASPQAQGRLTVEIAEPAAARHCDDVRGLVAAAKDSGCRVAIDRLGGGYGCLAHLGVLGVDIIKVDGTLVRNLLRSAQDRAVVRTLVELGRSFELATVATWVQDEGSAALLAEMGCECMQGALVGLASLQQPDLDAPVSRAAIA